MRVFCCGTRWPVAPTDVWTKVPPLPAARGVKSGSERASTNAAENRGIMPHVIAESPTRDKCGQLGRWRGRSLIPDGSFIPPPRPRHPQPRRNLRHGRNRQGRNPRIRHPGALLQFYITYIVICYKRRSRISLSWSPAIAGSSSDESSRVASISARFRDWSARIFSSTVPRAISLYEVTTFVCPNR